MVIVYLHGSGFSHIAWVPLAGQFTQKGYSVLVLDFPGHGNSEGESLKSIEENAKWLKELLKKLDLKKATSSEFFSRSINSVRICFI